MNSILDINTRIKNLYENCSMTPEQIAADEQLDVGYVKLALQQSSGSYREGIKAGTEEDISQDEYKLMLGAYKQLALTSENESVKERALWNLINEKKGRNDNKVNSALIVGGVNILELEKALSASQRVIDRIRNRPASLSPAPPAPIDVEVVGQK